LRYKVSQINKLEHQHYYEMAVKESSTGEETKPIDDSSETTSSVPESTKHSCHMNNFFRSCIPPRPSPEIVFARIPKLLRYKDEHDPTAIGNFSL